MTRRRYKSPWCVNGHHQKCPVYGQVQRTSPKGKEHAEVTCSCSCHAVNATTKEFSVEA